MYFHSIELMQNTISFHTKFGWITATEKKNKINSIMFKRDNKKSLKSPILLIFQLTWMGTLNKKEFG